MKCVLCQRTKFQELYQIDSNKILKCQNCGLVRTERKNKVKYQDYHRDQDYQQFEKHFQNIFQKRYHLISRFKQKPGKVLEIGCSTGILLNIFRQNGWQTMGIEPSKSGEVARERGIEVTQTIFEKAKLSQNRFDLVILNHTLEHTHDPLKVLDKVKQILKKRGMVYLDVPNFDSLSARIRKQDWPYLLPEEHNYHFTPETLKKLVKKAGLKPVYQTTWSGLFDLASPLQEIWLSLTTLKKRFFINLITLPKSLLEILLNRGTNLVIIGEKV